jgi:flagellar motor protein MotB
MSDHESTVLHEGVGGQSRGNTESPNGPPAFIAAIASHNDGGRQWGSLASQATFWSAVVVGVALSSWSSANGLFFAGVHPVPLRLNPALLCLGAVFGAIVLLNLWSIYRNPKPLRVPRNTLTVLASVLFLGTIVSSLYPGPGALAVRDSLPPVEVQKITKSFGLPAFFTNGVSSPTAMERKQLAATFKVFRHCEAGALQVRGFASSAPFRGRTEDQSQELNRQLANNRAVQTRDLLTKLIGVSSEVVEWDTYAAMAAERRLIDINTDGNRIPEAEELNRRVEIFWNDSACVDAGSKR